MNHKLFFAVMLLALFSSRVSAFTVDIAFCPVCAEHECTKDGVMVESYNNYVINNNLEVVGMESVMVSLDQIREKNPGMVYNEPVILPSFAPNMIGMDTGSDNGVHSMYYQLDVKCIVIYVKCDANFYNAVLS